MVVLLTLLVAADSACAIDKHDAPNTALVRQGGLLSDRVEPHLHVAQVSPQVSASVGGCGGSYVFAQLDTLSYTPLLGPRADRKWLSAQGDAASWYDVECDTKDRPSVFTRYRFGQKAETNALEYDDATGHVARNVTKRPDGTVNYVTHYRRDTAGRPIGAENVGPDGERQLEAVFNYKDGVQELNLTDPQKGAPLSRARKWFNTEGALTKAYWYYPRYWFGYDYDPKTGLYMRLDKYDGSKKFATTAYEYDSFGNPVQRMSRCLTAECYPPVSRGQFDHGNMVREEAEQKDRTKLVWDNQFNADGQMIASLLSVNGHFALKFVIERNGTAVQRTLAYSPKGEKLFAYDSAETVYLNRDGSPVNGGKFERFTQKNIW
ncbi:hypothetical protein DWF00_00505 [Bosea caraganae]|uniref:RHS repeat protein n=1 Tax=Bosea caraganae TaxID=2763117 RepID=A0A370L8U0_9HYPH|nr:hypothetical protein DWE98_07520 [Bosea caraganae]RDJ30582.1 hypothetical protein DWF00_00505 [Bosea caraganae]